MALSESVQKILRGVDDSHLDSDSLFDIESEVIDIAAKWESFGLALRIPQAKLSTIKATPGSTPESCLKATLLEFLKKNYNTGMYGDPSWRLVVTAVAHRAGGDNVDLALKIARKHSSTPDYTQSTRNAMPPSTPSYKCRHCNGIKKVYRDRKTMFDWMDGRGSFDIVNCVECKGNDYWLKCSKDPGAEYPGILKRPPK